MQLIHRPILTLLLLASILLHVTPFIVSYRAERRIPRTELDVQFQVSVIDRDPAKAIQKATKQADSLVKAVSKLAEQGGVSRSQPNVEAVVDDDGSVTGYEVTIEVEVDVERANDLAAVIKAASKYGRLQDVEYEVSSEEERKVREELVHEAYSHAEKKAKAYAQKLGVRLGALDTVDIDDLSSEEQGSDESSQISVEVALMYHLDDEDSDDQQSQQQKAEQEKQKDIETTEEKKAHGDGDDKEQDKQQPDSQSAEEEEKDKQDDDEDDNSKEETHPDNSVQHNKEDQTTAQESEKEEEAADTQKKEEEEEEEVVVQEEQHSGVKQVEEVEEQQQQETPLPPTPKSKKQAAVEEKPKPTKKHPQEEQVKSAKAGKKVKTDTKNKKEPKQKKGAAKPKKNKK